MRWNDWIGVLRDDRIESVCSVEMNRIGNNVKRIMDLYLSFVQGNWLIQTTQMVLMTPFWNKMEIVLWFLSKAKIKINKSIISKSLYTTAINIDSYKPLYSRFSSIIYIILLSQNENE